MQNAEDSNNHHRIVDTINFSTLCQDPATKGHPTAPSTRSTSPPYSPNDDTKKSSLCLKGLDASACTHFRRFSCLRTITALAPLAHVDFCSYSVLEKLIHDFLSGMLEDYVLHSLNLLVEGKASGRESVNFLRNVGMPSFNESNIPGCLRHPNIVPVLGLLKSSHYVYSVLPKAPNTLESILYYCPNALESEWHIRFLAYQLLSALAFLHGLGVFHGNICPANVMLTDSCWSWLNLLDESILGSGLSSRGRECNPSSASAKVACCIDGCPSQGLYADLSLSTSTDWASQFQRWWTGELDNFEYLLILNRLAGRRWGDNTFHTVMPWVIDFSRKPDDICDLGWRDLSKSKWRLAKGDEQLDFTYSSSEIPHHISDECLSELAVCSYKARRLPLSVLCLAVRSVYEPNEYPSNMQRLYQWTPDECIPEFYCDPQIFYSLHSGMADLAVPSWAGSPEEFIKLHRDALESEWVSSQIHNWIDITFGYKMSGQAAVEAKNVMLPSSEPTMLRSMGRRQLFMRPHPARRDAAWKKRDKTNKSAMDQCQLNEGENGKPLIHEFGNLTELEDVSAFIEHAEHLSPHYCCDPDDLLKDMSSIDDSMIKTSEKSMLKPLEIGKNCGFPLEINLNSLLEHIEEVEDEHSMEYQELLLWQQKSSNSRTLSNSLAKDLFSVGCILAELYLKKPLFNSTSLVTYVECGILPGLMQSLPPQASVLVEACIQKDWTRRPSAKSILESPFFPTTVKSSYLFIAPLMLLANDGSRLQYAANFAKQGALKAMGTFAAEMCAPYCLPLVMRPQSDAEAECAYVLLKELIKCVTPKAVKTLILPTIQKILQTTGYSHLKVSLLQGSFMQETWNLIGKKAYLEKVHPLVISNLHVAPHKRTAIAASVLLISTSEELGVPITINQTILPLIHCFGKGLYPDGIDVLVRIGSLFGENFIVRQMIPLLKQAIRSCINISYMNKPEPVQSWSALAIIDCLTTLEGLVVLLPKEVLIKELIDDRSCLIVMVLMQTNLEVPVLQVAAATLMEICHQIGPDLTALHVLPQLKELFDELAFSQEIANDSGSFGRRLKISKSKMDGEAQMESRMDLVLLLYPSFASLLGIEKLRQCCTTWLLLEQFLLRYHNWKWEYTGESSRSGAENITVKRPSFNKAPSSEYNPAKLLLNGVGWSIPQSQGTRGAKNLMMQRWSNGSHQTPLDSHLATSNISKGEPWFWFPSPAAGWDGPDFLGRIGNVKDEFLPWKIRASIIYSIRAHHGALKTLAVSQDECTVFTAGVGPGFKGTVQKWELSRINCTSGYHGHEEVGRFYCMSCFNFTVLV
uniref:Putative inactive serine/threonine-protein kinase lvsG isoform X1 n=1 Tax=Rhizophora mucronata TaxID=61149 RepID=A0A2P2K6P1_RHIMU